MSILPFVYTLLASVGGGMVQAATGFGFGIFVMIFFPLYLPMLQASALSSITSLFVVVELLWHYRKSIRIKNSLLPAIVYLAVSTSILIFLPGANMKALQIGFAVFMLLLALYMMAFSSRIHARPSALTAVVCSSLSGAAGGLFGLGGPPMTVYFMSLYGNDKAVYMGSIQFFFLVTTFVNNCVRFATGTVTGEVFLLLIPGVLGQAIGTRIGTGIAEKISVDTFRKVVYGFLVVSGALTLLTNLL